MMPLTHYRIPPGEISHGTLRSEDLLSALLPHAEAALEKPHHHPGNLDTLKVVVGDVRRYLADPETFDETTGVIGSELVGEMLDMLSDYVPEGHILGMHEGDGSSLGVWEIDDAED